MSKTIFFETYISDFSYLENEQNDAVLKLIYGTTLVSFIQCYFGRLSKFFALVNFLNTVG